MLHQHFLAGGGGPGQDTRYETLSVWVATTGATYPPSLWPISPMRLVYRLVAHQQVHGRQDVVGQVRLRGLDGVAG